MTKHPASLLKLDLTTGRQTDEVITEDLFAKCLGGSGVAAWYALKDLKPDLQPLDPDQVLFVMAGRLTGIYVPAGCKSSFCGRSPHTGIWNEATVGGYFGLKLRASGWEGLAIIGRAGRPSVLYVDEKGHSLDEHPDLWGKDTYETDRLLKERYGSKVVTACIGPAGEKMVSIASVIIGGHEGRAAGRGGMGALMGSKNLKAIVLGGTLKPGVCDPAGLKALVRDANREIRKKTSALARFGTAGGLQNFELSGDMPFRNFGGSGRWEEGAGKICGQAILERYFVRHYGCYACPIMCGKVIRHQSAREGGVHSPEYETAAGFGALCLNADPDVIIEANDMCNRLGLDTISTSAAIAFAMELSEKGLLDRKACEGMDVSWGNREVIPALVGLIAEKEGLGALLGKGTRSAAAEIGGAAAEYAIHSKGLEYPFHDPRAFPSMGLNYATANRGGCHLEGLTYFVEGGALPGAAVGFEGDTNRHSEEGRADLTVRMQNYMNVLNAVGLCKFIMRGGISPDHVARWLDAAWDYGLTGGELMQAGARLHTLKRLYNCRLGISRKDDLLPPRILTLDRGGSCAGIHPHIGKMLGEYYGIRGWSEEGIPRENTLRELGIDI